MSSAPTPHSIRRNTMWMLAARTLRTIVAAGYFTLLARALGVTGYGAFVGACALAAILSPFASLGSGNVLIQSASRDRTQFAARWTQCLTITLLSGTLLTSFVVLTARFALPHSASVGLVTCIALADLIFARLVDVAGQAFQAFEQLHVTAAFTLALTASRMLAAGALLCFAAHTTAAQWSVFYLISTAIPACTAIALVHKRLHPVLSHRFPSTRDIREGLHFSIGFAAQTIYNDLDKAMLARLCSLGAAGLYAAAYRIVDAAFSPILSVLAATYARFFQHGARGLHATTTLAKHLLRRTAIYSVCAILALWIAAPYLPHLLGRDFADAMWALRWLSPLLLLRSLHYFAADSLTGAGHQRIRTLAQLAVALLNFVLNLAVLPWYSWRGAVVTSLISDGSLAILLWAAVWHLRARESVRFPISDPTAAQA